MFKKLFSLFCILAVVAMIGAAYIYKATRNLPSIETMVREGLNPSKYTQVFASDGTPILSHGKFHHNNVPINDVSHHFIDALLATEDRRFYQHYGVDPIAIGRAVVQNVMHKSVREGGSTLTQQLARNVFLSNERSMERKVREAALSWKLEEKLTKDEILELYINNIYFGEGAYGIAAASEIYFGKKPSRLTVEEAAFLAGLPQAPSAYSPYENREAATKRRNEVIDNLVEVGKLSKDDATAAKSGDIRLNASGQELARADRAPYFNRYIMSQILKSLDMDEQTFWQSGLKVYTTLDVKAQTLGQRIVREQSIAAGRTGARQQASLISINPQTGAILAYVGGKDYTKSQFDRVSQATRSPGSLFKVFTYTAAIDRGYDPKRVYADEPVTFNGWTPTNYDKKHHGYMTLAKALTTSNNVIAVKVLNEIGPQTVVDIAHSMGIHSQLNPFLALTLGGSGVNLLEITSAFGVLANQGVHAEPYGIEKIMDNSDQVIYEHAPVKANVLARGTVDTMVKIMMGVVQRGTGKAADIGRPMAGKTGTSDDYRDAWFIGFTPNIVTGVWVGNDNNTPMPGMTGGSLPAKIWKSYMQPYTAGQLVAQFDLAYSKPLAENDFVNYDINNLSPEDLQDPNAAIEGQGAELETDPNAASNPEPNNLNTPPITPSGGRIEPVDTLPPAPPAPKAPHIAPPNPAQAPPPG